jgi:HPt (histidine-containing phosphotransfer) domain-containing protein
MVAVKRLVNMYLSNHPQLLEKLQLAIEQEDLRGIRQVVHDVRGSCVLFAAERCLALARDVDDALSVSLVIDGAGNSDSVPAWRRDALALLDALEVMAVELQCSTADPVATE